MICPFQKCCLELFGLILKNCLVVLWGGVFAYFCIEWPNLFTLLTRRDLLRDDGIMCQMFGLAANGWQMKLWKSGPNLLS